MDPDHKREQPDKPNKPDLYPDQVPFIYRQNRFAVNDNHGDTVFIFPFNLLLACTSDKFIRLHVMEAGVIREYLHPVPLKDFANTLPHDIFWHESRFHMVNAIRITRICDDDVVLEFDHRFRIKLERKISPLFREYLLHGCK